MPAKNQTCYAFIQLPGSFEWVICGVLNVNDVGQNAYRGIFQYGRSYLARQNVPSLDPYNLPLSDRPQEFTKLRGIPGALRDASPDAWGRRVIQAKLGLQEADLSEVDYLLNGPDDGAGNLRFGPSTKPPTAARPFNRTHQLRALTDATQTLEESGTSMGGARPKVSIEDNNTIWLAKLPEKNDKLNMQRIEYATLELARFAGLDVCETRLEKVGGRDALLLARFDRQWHPDAKAYARFGMVSALTVLDAEDGYLGRDRWSYLLLADELRRWSSHPEKDRLELFRRMVFNAMVTNNDDHPRNHALLQVQGAWRLSPAYDIVPVPAMSKERRDLALQVGAFGRSASVYNLLSQPEVFGLSAQGARAEIDRMREKVSHWQAIFKKYGVCEVDIVAIAPAMLPQSFERIEPTGPI